MPFTRTELVLILLITAMGFAVRFAFLDELAIEHFDEGVYASNLWFPDAGYAYPNRHLYAPPLLPSMVEFCLLTFGEAKWVPFLPGLVLGSLTVPLAWLAGRSWFDPAVGIAFAAIIAGNDFHIAMSRSALTDVPLLFFLLLAVWLLSEALLRVDLRLAVAAGLATALAWATKYNGWLPLAIGISGVAGMLIVRRLQSRQHAASNGPAGSDDDVGLKDCIVILGVTCLVAFAGWSPVLSGLQDNGGYAAVAENHQRYIVGVSGWYPSFTQHMQTTAHYFGPLTVVSGLVAATAAWFLQRSCSTWNAPGGGTTSDRSTWNTGLTPQAAFAIGVLPCLLLIPLVTALACLYGLTRCALWRTSDPLFPGLQTGQWLCAAWLCGLVLVTPLYQPYPRLILPLLAVTWLLTSAWTVLVFRYQPAETSNIPESKSRSALLIASLGIAGLLLSYAIDNGTKCWQPRTDLAETGELAIAAAADHARGEGNQKLDFVIYTYGEPGLFFHLPREGVPVQPVTDLNFALPGSRHPRIPTFVLTGPNTQNDENFAEHFAQAGDALQEVGVFPYEASDFVLLDDHSPNELADHRTAELRLYRVRFP